MFRAHCAIIYKLPLLQVLLSIEKCNVCLSHKFKVWGNLLKLSRVVKLRVFTLQTHPKKTVNTVSTVFFGRYSKIVSTNSPSFCTKTVSAGLTKLTALLPQTRDCSCYISRRMLAPTLPRLHRHTDLLLRSLTLPAPEAGVFMELIFL